MRSNEDPDSLHWMVHSPGAVLAVGGARFGSFAADLGCVVAVAARRDGLSRHFCSPPRHSFPPRSFVRLAQISLANVGAFARKNEAWNSTGGISTTGTHPV